MPVDVGIPGAIITGGLGRPACRGMITSLPFQLVCEVIVPPIPPTKAVSGGSIPLAPGEIQDFYQPVDSSLGTQPSEGQFADPSVYGKKVVKVTMRFQDHVVEKEYLVTDKRAKHVIRIINLVNATKARMKVMASNIHRVTTRAVVKVKNLRIKYFGNK